MNIWRNEELENAIETYFRKRIEGWYPTVQGRDEGTYGRTGIHSYDVIFCPYKSHFRNISPPTPIDAGLAYKFALGHMVEDYITGGSQSASQVFKLDGIQVTPDIVNLEIEGVFIPVGEVKTTYASERKFDPNKYQHYIVQMANECMATDNRSCDLIVFFVNGMYDRSAPPQPIIGCWKVNFSWSELCENWEEMVRRKEIIRESIKMKKFPEDEWLGFENECKYCDFANKCPAKK